MSRLKRFLSCLAVAGLIAVGGALTGCADSFTASTPEVNQEEATKSNKVLERYFRLPPSGPIAPGENTTNTTPSDSTSAQKS